MGPARRIRIGEALQPQFASCGCGESCGSCGANYGQGPALPGRREARLGEASRQSVGQMGPWELLEQEALGPHRALGAEPEVEAGAPNPPFDGWSSDLGAEFNLVSLVSFTMGLPAVDLDIYFSAGPRTGSEEARFGCSMRLTRGAKTPTCSMYRVRIRVPTLGGLGAGAASVWRIKHFTTGNRDRFQPAVLDEGTRTTLAYTLRLYDDKLNHAITAKDLTRTGRPAVRVATNDDGKPGGMQFPAWANTRTLMWSQITDRAESSVDTLNAIFGAQVGPSGAGMAAGSSTGLVGRGTPVTKRQSLAGGAAEGASFQDSARQPRSLAGGKRVYTMHSKPVTGASKPAVPIVSKLTAKGDTLEYESFNLGFNPKNDPVEEGHHPDWGITDEVMCHDQAGYQESAVRVSGPIVYERTGSNPAWGPAGSTASTAPAVPAFPMPSISTLESQFAAPLVAASMAFGATGSVAFKYMKFTDDPDLVVGTLMMADTADFVKANKGFSRVVLVRRSDGQIWDLTRLIEAMELVSPGEYGAWAPTSASPASL